MSIRTGNLAEAGHALCAHGVLFVYSDVEEAREDLLLHACQVPGCAAHTRTSHSFYIDTLS